ncbi:MAG TPA: histidine kinase [Spirochaeta sp.]|nr:histidine kinase [Spirochaeta sp.]
MILTFSSFIPAFSFILYIVFAVFGLSQIRKERIFYSFILYMFMMSLWSFGSFMMHANTGIYTPLFWNRFMMMGMLGGPITIFHALLDLTEVKAKRYNLPLYLGYAMYVFLLYLNFSGQIVHEAGVEGDLFYYSLADGAILAYALSYFYLILALILLIREIRKTKDKTLQRKLRFPIFGVIILLLGVLTNLDESLGRYPIDLFGTNINAIFIFFAIYQYKLVHYSTVVLKTILYIILVIISGTVFYGIFWLFSSRDMTIPVNYTFAISLLLGAVAAVIFQPLRKGTFSLIEILYLGNRLGAYHSLREFSNSMTSIVDLYELGKITTGKIVDTYHLDWAAMLVIDYSTRNYSLIGWKGLNRTLDAMDGVVLDKDSSLIDLLFTENGQLVETVDNSRVFINISGEEVELSPTLVLPLSFKDRVNGCIILGKSEERNYYNQFDIETLEILKGHCSITLENAISFERLKNQQHRLQELNTELTVSRNKLEAFFDGITTPISIQDINYNIVMVNYAATKYFHTAYDRLIGKKCYSVFFDNDKPCEKCSAQDCLHTQLPFTIEQEKQSSGMIFDIHFYPISVPSTEDKMFLEFFLDITQQKKLQAELIQSEKLAGIGTLASGIAHEINNPLGGILGTAEIMLEQLEPDSQLHEYTSDIIKYSENAAEVIKELTSYSRKEDGGTELADIGIILKNSLKLAMRGMDFSEITVEQEIEDIPRIELNSNGLQQVFLNLIVNAVQSMPSGGLLSLRCQKTEWNAIITISDTGIGIEKNHLEDVFDPFFTTKNPGQGTGLGLSISHKILLEMGGRISIKSKIGQGTEISVELPITAEDRWRIRFVQVRTDSQKEDVFYLQRKILVGEKGYREESIGREADEQAFHFLAYKGLMPVGTVSCLTDHNGVVLPIAEHVENAELVESRRCAEIDRLAVLVEERGSIIPLGLMTLAYLHAKTRGTQRLFLDVFSDEKKQTAMYGKLGFQKIGSYSDPLKVDVMMLDHRTNYETKQQRMEHFVKPFINRLIPRIEFDKEEEKKILAVADALTSAS